MCGFGRILRCPAKMACTATDGGGSECLYPLPTPGALGEVAHKLGAAKVNLACLADAEAILHGNAERVVRTVLRQRGG